MIAAMITVAPKIVLSLAGLAAVGFGGLLWLKYGTLVYFDTIASAFIGCFI
jgi:hypothetical protein